VDKGVEDDAFLNISSLYADQDPGSDAFLTPGWKKFRSASGMNIPNHFSESLETVLRVKNT
jgi:hypothetical protein